MSLRLIAAAAGLAAAIVGLSPLAHAAVRHQDVFGPGSHGGAVRLLQTRLHHAGYSGVKATGDFGPVTERAVLRFQRAHHLRVDGVVGPRTEYALETSTASFASPVFAAAPPRIYRVKRGDTLSSIARRFHVNWLTLARLNHLRHPGALHVGQVIEIWQPKPPAVWRYRVKRGDTLAAIAGRFHTTWLQLAGLNHLVHPNQLKIGSWLRIQGAGPRRPLRIYHAAARISLPLGRRVIATALRYRGVPYVWGGESPRGFDCSGLVQYVLARNGIHIGRTTWQQYRAVLHVARSALAPGDLVFFRTYAPGASHVGIYIGADQGMRQAFIDAPAPGQNVKVQNLDTPFWQSHYYGAGIIR